MNFDRLRYVSEMAEVGEGREVIMAVTIPEKPGSFQTFCNVLGKRPITEFNYRYGRDEKAQIYVGVKVPEGGKQDLLSELTENDYPVVDLSENEIAKYHIRHMVGGHAPESVSNEILYRFEFPERPGALLIFLKKLGKRWNISMFHYRNHGAASGRVLVGLQVPKGEEAELNKYLDEVAYPYWEESDNPAYKLFLR
jgi:threonine dehydratase